MTISPTTAVVASLLGFPPRPRVLLPACASLWCFFLAGRAVSATSPFFCGRLLRSTFVLSKVYLLRWRRLLGGSTIFYFPLALRPGEVVELGRIVWVWHSFASLYLLTSAILCFPFVTISHRSSSSYLSAFFRRSSTSSWFFSQPSGSFSLKSLLYYRFFPRLQLLLNFSPGVHFIFILFLLMGDASGGWFSLFATSCTLFSLRICSVSLLIALERSSISILWAALS